jgi:carbon-monoxide dehydrogenase large subunit
MTTLHDTAKRRYVGQPIPRKEDLPLLTGTARFLDDIRLPRMLYAKVLRSPTPHARIRALDTSGAWQVGGVRDVLTAADLLGKVEPWGDMGLDLLVGEYFAFATDKVVYEGQEVAAVAAESPYAAWVGIEAIRVGYEELAPILDPEAAADPQCAVVQENSAYEFGSGNLFDKYRIRIGDRERAEQDAAAIVRQRFVTNRPVAAALEPHGCIADYDSFTGVLTLYTSTQSVHIVRDALAKALHLPRNKVKVIAPEVGGGFGSKAQMFPWEVIASVFSMRQGRPVHLVLSRAETFLAGTARSNEVRYATLSVDRDGRILGYQDVVYHNAGAVSMWGNQTLRVGTNIGLLPYPIPHVHVDGLVVHTTTAPAGALRGFGVPQTIWAKEQLVDMAAEKLGMDPIELRLRNIPERDECPLTTPMGQVIDSTSLADCLRKVRDEIGWQAWRAQPRPPYEGVGVAVTMKHTSVRHPSVDSDLSAARVRLEMDGTVTVYSSDVPHGQGHATFISQLVADALGVSIEKVHLAPANTDTSPFGLGTWGSRSAAVLGTAIEIAAGRVRGRALEIASHILEVPVDELETGNDRVFVRGRPNTGLLLENLALLAAYKTHQLPDDFEPGVLEATATYNTKTDKDTPEGGGNWSTTYSSSAHAVRLRVNPDTGHVQILRYVMANDSGNIINPLIVEGQHQGGFLHGFGMVFGEDLQYDASGRMHSATFKNYYAPLATDVPDLTEMHELPEPSRSIPGGQKGAGETTTTPVPAAIGNALYDAIGVRFSTLPITPESVLLALREKERRGVDRLVYPDDMPGRQVPEWPEISDDEVGVWW